jgi:hypothetical protein
MGNRRKYQKAAEKKAANWDNKTSNCPICGHRFYDRDMCKHGVQDVYDRFDSDRIRAIARDEINRAQQFSSRTEGKDDDAAS